MSDAARPGAFTGLVAAELLRIRSRRLFRWLFGILLVILLFALATASTQLRRNAPFSGDPDFALGAAIAAFFPPLLGFGLVVGASHVGAEWSSRGVTNLLFWEPRRVRVIAAKLLSVALTVFSVSATLLLVTTQLLAAAVPGRLGADRLLLLSLRMAILIAIAALLAATIAAVARSTTAAAGAAFVLLAIIEPLLYANMDGYDRIAITANAGRFVLWESFGSSPIASLVILIAYAAAFVTIAISVFRSQEMG